MKKTKRVALFLAVVLVCIVLVGDALAIAEGGIQQVVKILESPFLKLELNADVVVPGDDARVAVYETDYARTDDTQWKKMFFGSADAMVKDEWAGWNLEQHQVFYPEIEHNYSLGDVSARYGAYMASVFARYKEKEVTVWWGLAKQDVQAEGLQTTPEEAVAIAQDWINRLAKTMSWDGLTPGACYALPAAVPGTIPGETPDPDSANKGDQTPTGYYIVEYKRVLEGISVAFDTPSINDDSVSNLLFGDVLQLYIDDDGVFRVEGFYRSFTEAKTEPIEISLDEAIDIVRNHMDYVVFYPEHSTTEITEIGLCYRIVQALPTYDKDVNARTQARPAWRFASATNRNMQNVFVIFIDAITGEVLR